MEIIYCCGICGANHGTAEKALECEALGFHPLYKITDKALYQGDVATITDRSIVPRMHTFIYRFRMLPEDNPGAIIFICGFRREDELSPLPHLQVCA
ncbi:MAG: hypothetical protein COX30_00420 [Candidatus Moranbacteria bacterium CG23_combo_of_CG06-09_8_20_14_all_39_10]|nr:MAG: hypothetical protein COX30_00420 [Candidatus Moranbacteria bacterium CG23_combo_of_CG06-09_8_20_14_all_39_10]